MEEGAFLLPPALRQEGAGLTIAAGVVNTLDPNIFG